MLDPLSWPSPLLDETLRIDPYVDARADGDRVTLTLASGATVEASFTTPAEGVLRVRVAERLGPPRPSPMILPLEDRPAPAQGAGLEFGAYRRAGTIGPFTDPIAASGRLVGPRGHAGWIETAHLTPDAAVYGGGESFQGPSLRGRVRRLLNAETHGASGLDVSYINVPFFWSDEGWGVFAHSGAPVRADIGATHSEVAAFAVEDDELDLFVIEGDAPTILQRYLAITGAPAPLPEWALGVWMSRCSYLSAEEIRGVVRELREAGCPVDVIHVDAWVEGNVIRDLTCNWTIDRERFPEGWTKDLGVRVSLWQNPYVLEGTPLAKELESAGFLLGGPDGGPARTPDKTDRFLVDFTSVGAERWWRETVKRVGAEEGNAAFKPDFAEEVPLDATFADGRSGRQARNEYALRYQRATHEAMSERGSDFALFCRSGTAGSQRYPCHWVGDTPSTWDGLVTALRACLSLSLSGFAYVSHDIGGFWTPESFPLVQKAFEDMDNSCVVADVPPELFARWAQWGALSPVMRFHGTGRREPTAYPEPARGAAIEACRVRERLKRYLHASARDGLPLMRPMALAYPQDRAARDADLQYLLGPHVLVAPVLGPGGRRRFYVPPGRWAPLWGLEPVEGPGWTEVGCSLETFPAYVKEEVPIGAVVA